MNRTSCPGQSQTCPDDRLDGQTPPERGVLSGCPVSVRRERKQGNGSTTEPRLLSAQDAAKFLGVPYTSLRDIATAGLIPVVRFGNSRRWWFDRADLMRAIDVAKQRL